MHLFVLYPYRFKYKVLGKVVQERGTDYIREMHECNEWVR
jgi:hypothetical protein